MKKSLPSVSTTCDMCNTVFCSNTGCALSRYDLFSNVGKCFQCGKYSCYFCFSKYNDTTQCVDQVKALCEHTSNAMADVIPVKDVCCVIASMQKDDMLNCGNRSMECYAVKYEELYESYNVIRSAYQLAHSRRVGALQFVDKDAYKTEIQRFGDKECEFINQSAEEA